MKRVSQKKKEVKKSSVSVKTMTLKAKTMKNTKSSEKKASKKNEVSGIKKQYLKSNGWCNVTFKLPKDAAPDAGVVTIVGDFNNWNFTETEMKRLKSGDFKVTLKLHKNREYRFRYLIDSSRWENDWYADKYVPNSFGCDDSLVIV